MLHALFFKFGILQIPLHGKYVKLEDTIRELGSRFPQNPKALTGAKRRMGTAQTIFDTLEAHYGIGYTVNPDIS